MKRIMAIAATEKYILQKNYWYNAYENDVDNVSLSTLFPNTPFESLIQICLHFIIYISCFKFISDIEEIKIEIVKPRSLVHT